jgi:hypothetical protein
LYKLLHDTRRGLGPHVIERGVDAKDVLAPFRATGKIRPRERTNLTVNRSRRLRGVGMGTKAVTARCDHCGKPLRAGRAIAGERGVQFDSPICRTAFADTAYLKGLQNGLRVARSRFKTATIARAANTYRNLGGRDWPLVERLLRSLL